MGSAMLRFGILVLFLAACGSGGSSSPDAPTPDGGRSLDGAVAGPDLGPPPGGFVDLDGDGIDDQEEDALARSYLPFLSLDPKEGCPLAGILYRLRPHPRAPATHLHLLVDVLYQRDCGALGHLGDDEVFGVTIDPARPAPAGIVSIRAIAHQATPCQHISECGVCPGESPCVTASKNHALYPVVFPSKDKHGNYLDTGSCNGACFFANYCSLAAAPPELPLQNAGEPGKPLTRDLTTQGFITAKNGWTEPTLLHFDPWSNKNFGGAGNVTSDLTDDSFLTPVCN
jgi:hypothetical protein